MDISPENHGNRKGIGLAKLLESRLRELPSTFERLVYLASLRDPKTLRYRHPEAAPGSKAEEAEAVIQALRQACFFEWLGYSVEQQAADLSLYVADFGENKLAALTRWLDLEAYRALIPDGTGEPERRLFLTDVPVALIKSQFS